MATKTRSLIEGAARIARPRNISVFVFMLVVMLVGGASPQVHSPDGAVELAANFGAPKPEAPERTVTQRDDAMFITRPCRTRLASAVVNAMSGRRARAGSPILQAHPGLPAGAEATVNSFIKSQESRARGTEYKEGRKIVIGDLNNDGSPDVAVLYTLEGAHGGNDYNQYLAVFLSRNGKYVYKARRRIGGRFERNMDLKSIENGRVLFDTTEYLPKDPSCCPSKKGSTQFILAGERLIETKPESSK